MSNTQNNGQNSVATSAKISATQISALRKFNDFGVRPENYRRVVYPMEYTFDFKNEGDKEVVIEPMPEVLSETELRIVNSLPIRPHECYVNAIYVGMALKHSGIELCDGYCVYDNGLRFLHRFCKIRGRYFDPTLETVQDFKYTQTFEYHSVRLFEPHELVVLSLAIGKDYDGKINGLYATSTLDTEPYFEESKWSYTLSDEGYLIKELMPAYSENTSIAM